MKRAAAFALVLSFLPTFFPVSAQRESKSVSGLDFTIREIAPQPVPDRTGAAVERTEDIGNILRRLPPMPERTGDRSEFEFRPDTVLPPKTGETLAFRPAASGAAMTDGGEPLTVTRYAPVGRVPIAAELSITFSQPMTAIGTASAAEAPVRMEPPANGKWRWLGTRTLVFDPGERLPMATRFSVTVPKGTRSAAGGELAADVSWTFETAPVRAEYFLPQGSAVGAEPVIFVRFNQRIDAASVGATARAFVSGAEHRLRPATAAEIAADKAVSDEIKRSADGRWIALRPERPLPLASRVEILFPAGLPSAEGTVVTDTPLSFGFSTYSRFAFVRSRCAAEECEARDNLDLEFNNPIDPRTFDASLVRVEPRPENLRVFFYGKTLFVDGAFVARRKYRVTVSEKLRDGFGQNLGRDARAEFRIAPTRPSLWLDGTGFGTLDPEARPVFAVTSINHRTIRARVYAVAAEDFAAFRKFADIDSEAPPAFGRLVEDRTFRVGKRRERYDETRIDLAPALTGGLGHVVVMIEAISPGLETERTVRWLQATRIAADTAADRESMVVYTSELTTGKPLGGVEIKTSNGASGVSGADGVARLPLAATDDNEPFLIARLGADSAILDADGTDWTRRPDSDSLRWFVFSDRGIYRPGETVSVKGYVRRIAGGTAAEVFETGVRKVAYRVSDAQGAEIGKGNADVNRFGAFDFTVALPEGINLGTQTVSLSADGWKHDMTFRAEEFRRPEFEVGARVESAAPFYFGGSATLAVDAKYFSGGALRGASADWTVTSTPTVYRPPGHDDFAFGRWTPFWRSPVAESESVRRFGGRTGSDGTHRIGLDFSGADEARPYAVSAEARVTDVNRQAFAARTSLLVHPSELYVGLRSDGNFHQPGQKFEVDFVATDIDGRPVAGAPVSVVAELKDWQQVKGEWEHVTLDTQRCDKYSASEPTACSFNGKAGGTIEIRATVRDRFERPNTTDYTVWITGGSQEPASGVDAATVELIPERERYLPGETAAILVNSPVWPAEGAVTLSRNGIVSTERITLAGPSTVIRVPVEDRFVPNLHVAVELFGSAGRVVFGDEVDKLLPRRPAYAVGSIELPVSPEGRRLAVTAEPAAATLEPGGETEIAVAVRDADGKPVAGGEVAVVAVDESVLSLTGYRLADPIGVFYRPLPDGVNRNYLRESVELADPSDLKLSPEAEKAFRRSGRGFGRGSGAGSGYGSGGGMGDGTGGSNQSAVYLDWIRKDVAYIISGEPDAIRIRRDFNALALFSPTVRTDGDGRARVRLKLPDNLTRYRITAVATDGGKRFGTSESAVTARQILMVRPSPPRFLNLGDSAELPVVVENRSPEPQTVTIGLRAANAAFPDGAGRRLTIPANDRVELRIPVSTESAGTARFQVGAVAGRLADAAEFEIRILTPAATETFATYGTTERSGPLAHAVTPPADILPEVGGLEVTATSTRLQELTDAFIYLQNYQFECSEQLSSRMVSAAALRDVLAAFGSAELPSAEALAEKMEDDIAKLSARQQADGGFAFWTSEPESVPYVSVHVGNALARTRAKGYRVPEKMTARLADYLRRIDSKTAAYDPATRRAIRAYAIFVLDLLGTTGNAESARRLLAEAGPADLSAETMGWLLPVLAREPAAGTEIAEIRTELLNRVSETAGAATLSDSYSDGAYVILSSKKRSDAVVLEGLLALRESTGDRSLDDLIAKIGRGLLAGRKRGRWSNTQENAFVLLALDRYFRVFESAEPDFSLRLWYGDGFAGETEFRGRTTKTVRAAVPMLRVADGPGRNLVIDKQGAGRLYYRIAMRYAPRDLRPPPADHGFTVERVYQAADDPRDVVREPDGTWRIRSGARVLVRVRLVAPSRRHHVALVDRLPAGFEIINSSLVTSEQVPAVRSARFDHRNLRDDRAEFFSSSLDGGIYEYVYFCRATTPGAYFAPAARAEEMYAPETFGRSAGDRVVVGEK